MLSCSHHIVQTLVVSVAVVVCMAIGVAAPVLGVATESTDAVRERMAAFTEGLRIAAFCTGSADITSLRSAILRRTDDWSVVG